MASEVSDARSNVLQFPRRLPALPDDGGEQELEGGAGSMSLIVSVIEAMEPSFRDVALAGELGGHALPPSDLSERIGAETARYMAEQVLPLEPGERRRALWHLLEPVLAAALAACRASEGAARRARAAATEAAWARQDGGHWMEPRERHAETLAREAARLLIVAHERCQEARGVERAVGSARRGEAWHDAADVTG